MSIVSSYISSRAPVFKINVRASTLMDHILSIVAGLGVRVVIDVVGYEDHRLTGSLVGLWEGIVVQHFIKKSPKSFDPFVAYGVRVFIDFLFTESLVRLILTFLFTGMGVVFADIAPRVWAETGLRRFWRHFRRDLYILFNSTHSISYFARPRTVRFSPSQAPSVITSVPPSPSLITITTQAPTPSVPRKRPVPGSFPDYVSETDTDLSVRSPASDYSILTGHIRDRRPTVQTESEASYDPDEGNRSSSSSGTPTPSEADLPNLPNIEDEDVVQEVVLEEHKDESTPRPFFTNLPPTPPDTTATLHLSADEPHEVLPLSAALPQIPDDDDDWENISRREAQATPQPRFEDKSTSPLHVEPEPFLSPASWQAPASSTPIVADVQPVVPDIDPHAEQTITPADQTSATVSSNANASTPTNNEDSFNLLADFTTSDPIAQTSASRPPSYAPNDLGNLWGNTTPASPCINNIWGDMDKRGGAGANNTLDANVDTTNPFGQPGDQNDMQQAEPTTRESDEQQDSNTNPQAYVSPFALTSEDPTTEEPASSPDNAGSEPPATQQQDQNPTSSTSPPGTTVQPTKVTDPSSTEPTAGTQSPNTQQAAGKDPAAEQPTSSTSTQGENVNNDKTDVDPLPDEDVRLRRVLELRQEIIRVNQDTEKLRRTLKMLQDPVTKEQITEKEAKLAGLNARAERWYNAACGDDAASEEVNLTKVNAIEFPARVENIMTLALLKNQPSIKFGTGSPTSRAGKGRKTLLIKWLDELNLKDRTYRLAHTNGDNVVVKLPTS